MNIIYTIILDNGTVGTVDDSTTDGQNPMAFDVINVHLHDENGFPIEIFGKPVSILDQTNR